MKDLRKFSEQEPLYVTREKIRNYCIEKNFHKTSKCVFLHCQGHVVSHFRLVVQCLGSCHISEVAGFDASQSRGRFDQRQGQVGRHCQGAHHLHGRVGSVGAAPKYGFETPRRCRRKQKWNMFGRLLYEENPQVRRMTA